MDSLGFFGGTLWIILTSIPWWVYILLTALAFMKYAAPVLKRWWS